MQSFSSRIWTRVAEFISYDDNHYTTGTSKKKTIIVCDGIGILYDVKIGMVILSIAILFSISVNGIVDL